MNLLKKLITWLIGISQNVRSRFQKRKQDKALLSEMEKAKNNNLKQIESQIAELINETEEVEYEDVSDLLKKQTITELQTTYISKPTKIRKRIFELAEIEQELSILNKRLFEIQTQQKRLSVPIHNQRNNFDDKIIELEKQLNKFTKKESLVFSNRAIEILRNTVTQVGKLIESKLTKTYREREELKRKQEETKKQQVKQLISSIETLINQNKLQDAQNQLANAKNIIVGLRSSDQKKSFLEKLEALKAKIREKQIAQEAKRQADELKKQQEEAERRRLAEDAKREEEQKQRLQKELIARQQEEARRKKEEDKRQNLQRLLTKKSNWQDFADVLKENSITTLYHFTDKENIRFIKKYGGLFSWYYLRKEGIDVPYEGGGSLSKDLDRRYGLEDFVRVCFTENHPMMYVARNEGRIPNPIILKISTEVCEFKDTRFANMNATRNGHNCGETLIDLQKINFAIVSQRTHFNLSEQEKPYYQAEVLVKTWIPIEYITNINQF